MNKKVNKEKVRRLSRAGNAPQWPNSWRCDQCGWWNARVNRECTCCELSRDIANQDINLARLKMAVERDCYLIDDDYVGQIKGDHRDWC